MNLHYDGGRLTRYAAGEADPLVSEHVAGCAVCAAEVSRLRAVMDRMRVSATSVHARERTHERSQCPTEDALAGFVAGTLGEEERSRCMDHLAGCSHCAGTVASVARALATDEIAREVRAVELPASRPWQSALLPLAGAAVLALILGWPSTPPHRSTPVTEFPAATLIAPVGFVSDMPPLRWRAVPMADRYRVTLFAADGDVIYEEIVTDTVVIVPDSVPVRSGQTYFWMVAASTGWDRWVDSEWAEFSPERVRGR